MNQNEYIAIRQSQLAYYKDVPLYSQVAEGEFILYKPVGIALDNRWSSGRHSELFIHQDDKIDAIKELHRCFNGHLKQQIDSGNLFEVKAILCGLVEETLSEPRSGMLHYLNETVDVLVTGYSEKPALLKALASLSSKDYSTAIHSVNVMALIVGYCFYYNLPVDETKRLGVTALLHDIGKTEVPEAILRANRKLNSDEFCLIKSHTTTGYEILKMYGDFDNTVALVALEHHEKLDGSGYPRGVTQISYSSQLLSIIDCYEALTNEDRPYRRASKPLDALKLIKWDVDSGKYNKEIFEKICYSFV